MRFKGIALAALAVSLSSGCATVIKGTDDSITVNSLEEGTTLYVNGAARGKDSAFVNLKKGKVHSISAKKDGCQTTTMQTGESFDPTTLLGIFIDWGIITIPTDLISGAAWEISPTTYTVNPICPNEQAVSMR
ncbi:hypothetical protein [Marinobacter salarius]|uniref:PEGA domain-containing protein n=1 Tax=Marinobacter salarius TaxID=1420917 RepID=A0A1W6KFD5_9GAMM|nr:hypothetical protein [Marinobacter salarius]ARM86138.1 PEGA domain-containing protein [Marinobacter salarius]